MREPRKVPVEVEFTEGYQERFTAAVLKIYSGRVRKEEAERGEQSGEIHSDLQKREQVRVS